MAADPETYAWVDDEGGVLGMAGCVTVSTSATRDQVVLAFGTDLSARAGDDEDEDDDEDDVSTIAFTEVAGRQVAIEENGFTGSTDEVLVALSQGGRAASAFWNVNSMVTFGCAENGTVLYAAEFAFEDPEGAPEELVALLEAAYEADDEDPDDEPSHPATAMALLETWTGVRVTQAQVDAAFETAYKNPL